MRVRFEPGTRCVPAGPIGTPEAAIEAYRGILGVQGTNYPATEIVVALWLDPQNRIVDYSVFEGGCSVSINDTCALARIGVLAGASALVLIHNHPSGVPFPSPDDVRVTRKIGNALAPLGISLHDHLIVGWAPDFAGEISMDVRSMRESGDLRFDFPV